MKLSRLFITVLISIIAHNCICATHILAKFIPTSQADTIDYHLYINETKISPLKDTTFGAYPVKCLIAHCPLTLTNNSNDTLKYLTMSASWWDFYTLDNKNFALAADYWNVFKNGIVVRVLPPHQSVTIAITIVTYKNYYRGQKLRIAMSLQKAEAYIIQKPKTANMIWSNEVSIP
jgi:hypothetical protein